MPVYRCSWVFNLGRQGWKEEWFRVAGSPGEALTAMRAVTPARLDLLNPLVIVDQLKVSDEAILRDSLPDYTYQNQHSALTAGLSRDTASNSLLARAFSVVAAGGGGTLQYQRPVEISGLPDEWINYDGKGASLIPGVGGFDATGKAVTAPGQFSKSWDTWKTKMIANNFAILALDKSKANIPVKGFGVNPNTQIPGVSQGKIMVYAPGHNLTATTGGRQTSFRLNGAKFISTYSDPKGLGPLDNHQRSIIDRVHQWQDITPGGGPPAVLPIVAGVQTTATDWLQLAYDLPTAFGLLVYIGGGTVTQRVWTPQTITDIVPERFNSRDRGKAYFVPRGRARKRAC